MTTHEMAEGHLAQASEILPEAERAYQRGAWNLAIRRSQEVVKPALKAAISRRLRRDREASVGRGLGGLRPLRRCAAGRRVAAASGGAVGALRRPTLRGTVLACSVALLAAAVLAFPAASRTRAGGPQPRLCDLGARAAQRDRRRPAAGRRGIRRAPPRSARDHEGPQASGRRD